MTLLNDAFGPLMNALVILTNPKDSLKVFNLIQAHNRLIRFDSDVFSLLWDWGWIYDCLNFLNDPRVQIIASNSLGMLLDLNKHGRKRLLENYKLDINFDDLEFLEYVSMYFYI